MDTPETVLPCGHSGDAARKRRGQRVLMKRFIHLNSCSRKPLGASYLSQDLKLVSEGPHCYLWEKSSWQREQQVRRLRG